MKHFLHFNGAQYRFIAILLLVVFGISTATALESDDINTAILVEGSLPPTWTNDAAHPWRIPDGENYIQTPESKDDSNFTSTLSFSYTSSYPTEITFDTWRGYYYSDSDYLAILIDGEEKGRHKSHRDWRSYKFMLPAGSHTFEFVSVSTRANNDDSSYNSAIRDLKVLECRELETACLKEGSLPITFENDSDNMWITETGYIRSTTENIDGEATSKISTTFTIDKASLFSFEIRDYRGYSDYYNTKVYIDGVLRNTFASENWQYSSVVLYPGTHTIEFENWQGSRSSYYITEIRNVRLDQTWYEATLNNPGELGVRLKQALGDKNLQDAELVKINGTMNADDWATIKQLTGATAIDFTGTNISEIPNEGMRGLSHLSTVMLPETLTKIGDNAFRRTDFYQVTIPASVESIGREAWYQTPLQFISFEQDSKLSYIGYQTFYQTKLIEFIMPDSVTEIGRYYDDYGVNYYDECHLFSECKSLQKLHLSEKLTTVPAYIANDCYSLKEVNIPANAKTIERYALYRTNIKNITIAETVTEIRHHAFANSALEILNIPASVSTFGDRFAEECRSLKEVTLSPHCWNMNCWFSNCTALEKIVLPCATPPSISDDPFYGVNKKNIKLFVPDFAVLSYTTNNYWYNFTTTQASDDASLNDFWAIRGSLTLDESHVMRGTPSVELETGGTLVMDSTAVQSFNKFTYVNRESNPAAFLSRSNKVTANSLETCFYVSESNNWFFFSPVTDVKMSDITFPASDSWVIRYYDGARRASENATSGNWINVPADGTLHRGEGYIIQARAAGWLHMPAANTEHDKFFGSNAVTFQLADNTCETPENAGWNFVANPYPCYYDIYYIDMQAPITVWNGSTYRAYSLNDGDRGDDTFVLRPMQPFFVQKDNAELTTKMPLHGRRTSTVIDRTRAPRRAATVNPNRHKLNLELFRDGSDEAEDYTRIVINEEAQMAYETKCDASKFMSMDASVAQLYSFGGNNHPMAINERPYDDGNVALGVYLPEAGKTYRISALRADRRAWIYDAVTGTEHDLTMGDYYFTAAKAGTDNKRFTIRFAPGSSTVGSLDAIPVKVTGNTGYIAVSAPAGAKVAVYATDGTVMANLKAENGTAEIPAAAGIYIVKVNDETVKTIVK